eukprot:3233454-Alexandrium_andersonii.AAC.1
MGHTNTDVRQPSSLECPLCERYVASCLPDLQRHLAAHLLEGSVGHSLVLNGGVEDSAEQEAGKAA